MNGLKQIFTPAPPRYYTPERLKEEIVVYIPPTGSRPDRVPGELQNHVPKIIWDERLAAIQTRAAMYNRPLLERIYLAFAVLAVFILPLGLYQIIAHSMTLNVQQEESAKYFFEAKAITFAIFLGTILVFFAPLFIWRWIGQRRMNALLTSWAQSDRRASTSPSPSSPSGGGPPTWKCDVPSLFRSTARLTITIPRKSERSGSAFGFYGDSYMSARDFDREVYGGTMRSAKDKAAVAGAGPGLMGGRGTHDSFVGTINLFQPSPTRSAFGGPGAREKV